MVPLLAAKRRIRRLVSTARWRWLQASVRLHSYSLLRRRQVLGFLSASPNPALPTADGLDVTSVKLAWNTIGGSAVEVRVGSPDGELFCRGGPAGEEITGSWVRDGTIFFLQDVDDGRPLERENTLAVVRVSVLDGSSIKPKVSVLLVTFNHERYIRSALESVLAQQTTFPIEIIVADDGSTDRTRAILTEIAGGDRRVRLLQRDRTPHDHRSDNFFRGLDECRAEYIAVLEGDDYWSDPFKLQMQADFLETHERHPLCFHGCRVEYDDAAASWDLRSPTATQDLTTADILEQRAIAQGSTIMMRREVGDEIRPWRNLLGDWFVVLAASRLGPVGYLNRVMSVYRQHSNGVFSSLGPAEKWAECTRFYDAVRDILGDAYGETLTALKCERSYLAAVEYERAKEFGKARLFLAQALAGPPSWLLPYSSRYGVSPDEFAKRLQRKLRLYRFPIALRTLSLFSQVRSELRWLRLRWSTLLRSRFAGRKSASGRISAFPNPAPPSIPNPEMSAVMLLWTSSLTDAVEVRVGTPDGPLVSSAPSGTVKTGEWVSDGMIFFLQNVAGGKPLTRQHTLDVVRVTVKE